MKIKILLKVITIKLTVVIENLNLLILKSIKNYNPNTKLI